MIYKPFTCLWQGMHRNMLVWSIDACMQASTRLADFPRSGRVVSEWDSEDVRELIAQSYRIIYREMLDQDCVEILLIHHGAMPLEGTDPADRDGPS